MTYGELFSRFTQQHPEIAVDDMRPGRWPERCSNVITVFESGTHRIYYARYISETDCFVIED